MIMDNLLLRSKLFPFIFKMAVALLFIVGFQTYSFGQGLNVGNSAKAKQLEEQKKEAKQRWEERKQAIEERSKNGGQKEVATKTPNPVKESESKPFPENFGYQNNDSISNFKILSEKKGADGSIIRDIEFTKGNAVVKQTIILESIPNTGYNRPINPDTLNHDSLFIFIDKRTYVLAVVYKGRRIRQYRAVFGPDRIPDKMQKGDRRTPIGWFKVVAKKHDSRWERFILLNYPNKASYEKFQERKREGLIPQGAEIGGSIGIHGTYPTGVGMVDLGIGWTDGCISLKPKDVIDLYHFVWDGTRVHIVD